MNSESMRKKEFEAFYYETAQSVSRYVRCLCRDSVEAEDIIHESYLSAMARWDSFAGKASRKAWLIGIVRNTFLTWMRRRTIRKTVSLGFAPDVVSSRDTGVPDEYAGLWATVEKLDKHHREIIYLRFAGELSYAELAQTLDIPMGTVRSRLYRALKELKERFE